MGDQLSRLPHHVSYTEEFTERKNPRAEKRIQGDSAKRHRWYKKETTETMISDLGNMTGRIIGNTNDYPYYFTLFTIYVLLSYNTRDNMNNIPCNILYTLTYSVPLSSLFLKVPG